MAYSQAGTASPTGAASAHASRPGTASSIEGQQVRARGRTMPSAGTAAQVNSHTIGCQGQQNVFAQALDGSCRNASHPDSRLPWWRCSGQRRPALFAHIMPSVDAKQHSVENAMRLCLACRAAASLAWHPNEGCLPPPACIGRPASQAYLQMCLRCRQGEQWTPLLPLPQRRALRCLFRSAGPGKGSALFLSQPVTLASEICSIQVNI